MRPGYPCTAAYVAGEAGRDETDTPGHGELTDGVLLPDEAEPPTPPASELKPALILPPISPIDGRAGAVAGVDDIRESRFAVSELPAAVGVDVIANRLSDIDCFAADTSTELLPLSGMDSRVLRSADIDKLGELLEEKLALAASQNPLSAHAGSTDSIATIANIAYFMRNAWAACYNNISRKAYICRCHMMII